MNGVLLDASMFVAAISPAEIHHQSALEIYNSYAGDRPFVVPSLFRLEVLAALARRGESVEPLNTVEVLVTGPRFFSVSIDASLIDKATQVARAARLRAYDAVYVALALDRGDALLPLDSKVRSKIAEKFPGISLIVPAG